MSEKSQSIIISQAKNVLEGHSWYSARPWEGIRCQCGWMIGTATPDSSVWIQHQAEELATAGLLRSEVPSRDEIAAALHGDECPENPDTDELCRRVLGRYYRMADVVLKLLRNDPPSREELARLIWVTSRKDESTISAIGAGVVADAVLELLRGDQG